MEHMSLDTRLLILIKRHSYFGHKGTYSMGQTKKFDVSCVSGELFLLNKLIFFHPEMYKKKSYLIE